MKKAFSKPSLTVEEQLQLLKDRGLTILDDGRAQLLLEVVSLFRLSPYMRPFQHEGNPDHQFHDGTSLRQVVTVYRFDRELRNLVMDALERVEVAVRATISNRMAPLFGPHWYLDRSHFKDGYSHDRLIRELTQIMTNESERFDREVQKINSSQVEPSIKQHRIEHRKRDNYFRYYGETYGSPELPPSWAMLEELSLGQLSHLYKGIARDNDRKRIAKRFDLPQEVLGSWLHTFTFVRNCCAHHSRLWNRELSIPPRLPKSGAWAQSHPSNKPRTDRRLFTVLLMLAHLMTRISPDSQWRQRFESLISDYPGIPLPAMGMPEDWRSHPVWAAQ
ncbi:MULTISPECIES: Abi family protein [unclassified Thioalkalivibrio]|uniref:Abi family protein n=1 Tax=unclassified Thioalkalivibrio TaxID=2621013 RepID=UPI00036A5EA9|nr:MULTISPECIES: Abi family protein [unclassified Thioalkalivibrio]